MAATSSIGGLVSGLDTASIIDQLMQLESQSQTRLKTQQSTAKTVLSALQSLNTTVASLKTQAETLAKPATWQTMTGTVTGSGVSVSVATGASASSFSVTVDKVAVNHQIAFATEAGLDVVVAGAGVTITTHDGTTTAIDTGDGSLGDLVAGINAKTGSTGVTATAVKVADGTYRLLVQSKATGADSDFALGGADGLGAASVRAGSDAQVSLGLGLTATSASNTFADLVPGVTLTLDPAATVGSTATVNIAQDSGSVKDSVKALVDKVNSLLTGLDTQTKSAGTLAGDSTARSLRDQLANTLFGGAGTMATVGLQTDRDGMLVFDEETFDKAYAADPAAVAAQFTTASGTSGTAGWAARVAAVAGGASDKVDGTITTAINGRQTSIDQLQDSIDAWEDRLELRRSSLERQYAALETALSQIQSQGQWLTSQIAALPSYSSSDD